MHDNQVDDLMLTNHVCTELFAEGGKQMEE